MAKIPEHYNMGSREKVTPERLFELIERMYTDIAVAVNKKPDIYETDVDGVVGATYLANGDININNATNKVEMVTNHGSTTVTWKTLS